MHYAISTKVLGQTHMWNTQKQAIKLFEDFSTFYGFLNFLNTLKKQNKNKNKAKSSKKKHAKNRSKWYKSKQACKDAWENFPKHQKN